MRAENKSFSRSSKLLSKTSDSEQAALRRVIGSRVNGSFAPFEQRRDHLLILGIMFCIVEITLNVHRSAGGHPVREPLRRQCSVTCRNWELHY